MNSIETIVDKNISLIETLNGTADGPSQTPIITGQPLLKNIHDVLIVVLLVCVMFAMGCSITLEQASYLYD